MRFQTMVSAVTQKQLKVTVLIQLLMLKGKDNTIKIQFIINDQKTEYNPKTLKMRCSVTTRKFAIVNMFFSPLS